MNTDNGGDTGERREGRKDLTQRIQRNCGGKSEKNKDLNRRDAEVAEKTNGKDARLKGRRPLQIQRRQQLQRSRRDAGATRSKTVDRVVNRRRFSFLLLGVSGARLLWIFCRLLLRRIGFWRLGPWIRRARSSGRV